MFKTTDAQTPEEYLDKLDEPRQSEVRRLHEFIRGKAPHLEPFIISGMIGYGKYHYRYASGREGDWSVIALASQKNYISVYVNAVVDGQYLAESYKDRLPKASIGKSCVRFKRAEHIDWNALGDLLAEAAQQGGYMAQSQ